jgi:hypothetical protein
VEDVDPVAADQQRDHRAGDWRAGRGGSFEEGSPPRVLAEVVAEGTPPLVSAVGGDVGDRVIDVAPAGGPEAEGRDPFEDREAVHLLVARPLRVRHPGEEGGPGERPLADQRAAVDLELVTAEIVLGGEKRRRAGQLVDRE